jgi:NAD(P)-dependent dehydrogenase (short-subunit alcohol dehydrogenase family)
VDVRSTAGESDDGTASGRVVIVTGAGQGLGAEHALALARHGCRVVVNDVDHAGQVASQIRAAGGTAIASAGDVSDWAYAQALIDTAVTAFGTLDALVNNAGVNRDRMLATMSEQDWDEVLRIDLKGHFAPLRHAAAFWRSLAKQGRPAAARIVNTSSGAGLMGSVGQGNYAAAKAGIAALTVVAAAELARYGITVNAIAPSARTPMTEAVFAARMRAPASGFDAMHPGNVSPLVVWLASEQAGDVTGRMFEVEGGAIAVADGWRHGPAITTDGRWQVSEIGAPLRGLLATVPAPAGVYGA